MRHLRGVETAATMASAVMIGLSAVQPARAALRLEDAETPHVAIVAGSGLMMGSAEFLMLRALSMASAAAVAPMQYTMMIWAVFYGFVVFQNAISGWVIAGFTIVMVLSLSTTTGSELGLAQRAATTIPPTPTHT